MAVQPFVIGVLILSPLQLLDLASVDLFGMLSTEYLDACPFPVALLRLAHPHVSIHYISPTSPSTTPATCTSNLGIQTTHAIDSPEVQAGALDVLLIPGPDPRYRVDDNTRKFIRAHAAAPEKDSRKTVVMTVCTGIFAAGQAGILDGQRVTGPRGLLSTLRTSFPKAEWAETRWECSVDGRLWTSGEFSPSDFFPRPFPPEMFPYEPREWTNEANDTFLGTPAGITNGLDMIAAYLHSRDAQSHGISPALADLVCRVADVGERQQQYDTSGTREGLWWGGLMLRAVWTGVLGKTTKK